MNTISKRIETDFAVITIALVVDEIYDYGVIPLTKRWQTLGLVIAREEGILDFNLVEIRAAYEDMNEYRQRTQEFTLYFKKKEIVE